MANLSTAYLSPVSEWVSSVPNSQVRAAQARAALNSYFYSQVGKTATIRNSLPADSLMSYATSALSNLPLFQQATQASNSLTEASRLGQQALEVLANLPKTTSAAITQTTGTIAKQAANAAKAPVDAASKDLTNKLMIGGVAVAALILVFVLVSRK